MKRNINDLPKVMKLARSLGAGALDEQPHARDAGHARDGVCTPRRCAQSPISRVAACPTLSLPRDGLPSETAQRALPGIQRPATTSAVGAAIGRRPTTSATSSSSSMSVSWNGDVSPCWPLMHTHIGYLNGKERKSIRHVVGNVRHASLRDLWLDPEYLAYREARAELRLPALHVLRRLRSASRQRQGTASQPVPMAAAYGNRAWRTLPLGQEPPPPYAFLALCAQYANRPASLCAYTHGELRPARPLSVTLPLRQPCCQQHLERLARSRRGEPSTSRKMSNQLSTNYTNFKKGVIRLIRAIRRQKPRQFTANNARRKHSHELHANFTKKEQFVSFVQFRGKNQAIHRGPALGESIATNPLRLQPSAS